MSSAHEITWAGYLKPYEEVLATYGVDPSPAINATFVSGLLIAFAWIAGRRFRKGAVMEPEGKANLSFFIEFVINGMLTFFEGIIEHGARKLFFILGTFAFFILGNNLIGLIPGFVTPTDQYNVTVVLALIVFFTAHFIGIKTHGPAYIKKFMGPIWWIAPLMFPIEVISHLVRPLSLSVRLFGNMTGDHKVLVVFSSLVAVGLPLPFMGLGVFVAVLQAFVFVLLSSVYFQDAMEHAH